MDDLKNIGRHLDRHVLIASAITFGVMLLIWVIMLGFQNVFEDSSVNTPHVSAVFLGGGFFAVASMLLLQVITRFVPVSGVLGLVFFILAVVLERFILLKLVRLDFALLFVVYFNFSWLVLLGLNTYLKSSDD